MSDTAWRVVGLAALLAAGAYCHKLDREKSAASCRAVMEHGSEADKAWAVKWGACQ